MRFALVAFALVLASGCSKKEEETAGSAKYDGGTTVAQATIVDRESGVRLEPPVKWNTGLLVVESLNRTEYADARAGATFGVSFDYRAEQPGHRNQPLLRILVFDRGNWLRHSADGDARADSLSEEGSWVYAAEFPDSNPYRAESLDAEQFQQMSVSLEEVRSAFSVEGDGPTPPAVGSR